MWKSVHFNVGNNYTRTISTKLRQVQLVKSKTGLDINIAICQIYPFFFFFPFVKLFPIDSVDASHMGFQSCQLSQTKS